MITANEPAPGHIKMWTICSFVMDITARFTGTAASHCQLQAKNNNNKQRC